MDKVRRIISLLKAAGARDCLLVGGCVRDRLLGKSETEVMDYDIEAYGLEYEAIRCALCKQFRVGLVGKSFGVLKVDQRIDVSIPRREIKSGVGHTGFTVETDPFLSPREAMGRRDFTVNAIGWRLSDTPERNANTIHPDELVDPYDGAGDLRRKLLRATTGAFREDPLRVLRGMQFAARFGFDMDAQTIQLCRELLPEFPTLSPERLWTEWYKWATKGRFPSKGLHILAATGWIDCFPELAAIRGVPQNPLYHPEGDVFTHTCLAVDAAVAVADEMELSEQDRAILLFAVLAHDFGKPYTTVRREDGTWTSPNHAAQGIPYVESFFEKMRAPGWVIEHARPLVAEHMAHLALPPDENPSDRVVRRLAARLEPASVRMWAALCRSDARGCRATFDRHRTSIWQDVAEKLAVMDEKPRPLLLGRDLIPLGYTPGPEMGRLLKLAYEAQLDGRFQTHDDAIAFIREEHGS